MSSDLNNYINVIQELLNIDEEKIFACIGLLSQKSWDTFKTQNNHLGDLFSVDTISKLEARISDEILGKHLFERLNNLACSILCIRPFDDGQAIRQLEDALKESEVEAVEYLISILTLHLGVSIDIAVLTSLHIIKSVKYTAPALFGKAWQNSLNSSPNIDSDRFNKLANSNNDFEELRRQFQACEKQKLEAQVEIEKLSIDALSKDHEIFFLSNQQLEALATAVKLGKRFKDSKQKAIEAKIKAIVTLHKSFYSIREKNRIKGDGPSDWIWSVSFSPDGQVIASANWGSGAGVSASVKLWNPDGTLLKVLQEEEARDLSFSPNGQVIALANKSAICLKALDGTLLKTFEGHYRDVEAVSFSPDGQLIASASIDETVKLWNCDGELLHTFEGHNSWVEDVQFSPDGQLIASAGSEIKLWDCDGILLKTLDGNKCVSFSPNGQFIAAASSDNTIKIWNYEGTLLETLSGHEKGISSLNFSPDSNLLASASQDDNTIRLWKLEMISSADGNNQVLRGELLTTIEGRVKLAQDYFSCIRFSPDGKTLISSGKDISFWDVKGNQPVILGGSSYDLSNADVVSLSSDGRTVAMMADSPEIYLWNINGNFLRTLGYDGTPLSSASFSPDGRMIAVGTIYLKLWTKNGVLIRTFEDQYGYINSISFSPDGQIIAAAGNNIIKLWSIGGNLLKTLEGHEDVTSKDGSRYTSTIPCIVFSPDGQLLASASFDGTVRLWNLDGVLLKTFKGHTGYVKDVGFSPDGKTIISASDDRTIKLWSLNGEELKTLRGHNSEVKQAKFSPDGQFIVSNGSEGIKFWSPNGQEIATLNIYEIYSSNVYGYRGRISFTPDGKTLIVGKTLLNLDLDDLSQLCCDWISDYSKSFSSDLKAKKENNSEQSLELDSLPVVQSEGNSESPKIDEANNSAQVVELNSSNSNILIYSETSVASAGTSEVTNEATHQKYRVLNSVAKVMSSSSSKQGSSIIASIGINKYQYWPQLTNAVNDAIGFQQVLVDKLGFAAPIDPLLEEQANKASIITLVEDHLREVLKEEDNLVLFFAGHGHTRVDKAGGKTIGETGFLVPVEARGPKEYWSDYIQIDQFLQLVSRLPARHILVVFDSCHSGFALGEAMKGFRSSVRYEQDLGNRISRKVITSARREQFALDGGPIPGHSLFTGTLIDGLNWGKADLDSNGLITSSELGLFIQQKVGQVSEAAQTPDFGSFYVDDRGEMIISLRNQSLDALKARAFSALQQGKLEDFKERVEEVIALNSTSPEALYLEYRMLLFYPGSTNIERAIQLISQLSSLKVSSGIIPLSQNDLWQINSSLRSRKSLLSLVETEFPLEIIFTSGSDPEHLENTEEETLGSVNGYKIPHDFLVQLQVKNPTQDIYYVYMIRIDSEGRLSLDNLWQNWEVLANGIKPGEVQKSHIFTHKGAMGVYERRLFASSESLTDLLFPPPSNAIDPAWHGIDPIESLDLANVKMKAIRYCVTQSYEFLPSGTLDEVD